MNSNTVLGKIMTLLSLDRNDVSLTFARLADGTILESETFDVGEKVEVVHEDGTKSKAPDGEHEEETEEVEPIPATGGTIPDDTELAEEGIKVDEEVVDEDADIIDLAEVDKKVEELSYRIEELENKIKAAEEKQEEEEVEAEEEEVEIEMQSKKLSGAPVESNNLFNKKQKNRATIPNYHSSVLEKMNRA